MIVDDQTPREVVLPHKEGGTTDISILSGWEVRIRLCHFLREYRYVSCFLQKFAPHWT